MATYSFSPVRKYALCGTFFTRIEDARISVSQFTRSDGYTILAVALERRNNGRWSYDSEHAYEHVFASDGRDWQVSFAETEMVDKIHRAITGSFLPMNYYRDFRW